MRCEFCQKEVNEYRGLGNHLQTSKDHPSVKEYYDKYLANENNNAICNKPNCNNDCKFLSLRHGYRKNCSHKCSANNKTTQDKKIKTVNKKYGVDNVFQNKKIIKKSENTKLEKYGSITYNNVEKGHKTKIQKYGKISGFTKGKYNKHPYEKTKKIIEDYGYEFLTQEKDYKGISGNIEFICNDGHTSSTTLARWLYLETRCKYCSIYKYNKKSHAEIAITDFIKQHIPNVVSGDRAILYPLELDIYLPDLKIAFEYDGLYYHSDKFKPSTYHSYKTQLCKEEGITLYHIFEDEWKTNKDVVKSKILQLIGKTQTKIHARKCVCKTISSTEANEFCKKNHLQKTGRTKYAFGLFFNDVLVSVMTYNKTHNCKDGQLELNRFCSLTNTIIVGGANKLFKHSIKNLKCNTILSYCDLRWSTGKIYETLGFELSHQTKPNYWYIKGYKRLHRFRYNKKILYDILQPNVKYEDTTEEIMRKEANLLKLYDCGNLLFTYSI